MKSLKNSKIDLFSRKLIFFAFCLFLVSCSKDNPFENDKTIDEIARSYLRLALNLSRFDKDFVDAYYGPPEIFNQANQDTFLLYSLKIYSKQLLNNLDKLKENKQGNDSARLANLEKQLLMIIFRVDFLSGKKMSFDDECLNIYGVNSPVYPISYYDSILVLLERQLPGKGNLQSRFSELKRKVTVPVNKIDTVLKAAINACRNRTKRHFKLPENENYSIEYVKGNSWAAYNWYKGNGFSVIQISTDRQFYIDNALTLACHELYPGHHVFHTLQDITLYREKGWLEFSLYPLFSPVSLVSEGLANYGIELTFPGEEKIRFCQNILCKLAGIKPETAKLYLQVKDLMKKLTFAGNEVARRYLNGRMPARIATEWLMKYELMTKPEAEKYFNFIGKYRSYIINYNVGQEIVRKYIEKKAPLSSDSSKKWNEYFRLLSNPANTRELLNPTK